MFYSNGWSRDQPHGRRRAEKLEKCGWRWVTKAKEEKPFVLWRLAALPSICSQGTELQILLMVWKKKSVCSNFMHFKPGSWGGKSVSACLLSNYRRRNTDVPLNTSLRALPPLALPRVLNMMGTVTCIYPPEPFFFGCLFQKWFFL